MQSNQSLEYLLTSYGGAVPRYTSYPSAVQFKSDFQPLPIFGKVDSAVSLYVHIPFCRSLCSYCGCMTKVVRGDGPILDYLVSLENEISLRGGMTGHHVDAGHIHFGGGSPNLLDGQSIEEVIDLIDIHFNIKNGSEIAIEADPRQMTPGKARDYAAAGINRVSLGVQDFNPETQAAINRVQPFAMIDNNVAWLRAAGIRSINFDLMYGLPYQTVASVIDNVQKAVSLKPDRIAVFGYAHVPWMRPHQKTLERHTLPNAMERFLQADASRQVLLENGYQTIGMDHFSLPHDTLAIAARNGKLRRNFQGYTSDNLNNLIGLGISSISRFPNAFMQNTTSFKTYKEKLNQGVLPVENGCLLSAEDNMRSEIIENLMCYLSADTSAISHKHGFPENFFDVDIESLRPMIIDGLLERDGGAILVTEIGRPFVRAVCSKFDPYFDRANNRHARAV